MTFTLPGPTPGTWYECHHVYIGNCTPLEVTVAGRAVGLTVARRRALKVSVLPSRMALTGGAAVIRRGKVVKARRRRMTMKADRATFTIPT